MHSREWMQIIWALRMQVRTWKREEFIRKKLRRNRTSSEVTSECENACKRARKLDSKVEGSNCEIKRRFSWKRKAILRN